MQFHRVHASGVPWKTNRLAGNEPRSLPWKISLSVKLESGGGLLLLCHVTRLTRRNVVYSSSGAHTIHQRREVDPDGVAGHRPE
jgi:hypothetical protein